MANKREEFLQKLIDLFEEYDLCLDFSTETHVYPCLMPLNNLAITSLDKDFGDDIVFMKDHNWWGDEWYSDTLKTLKKES